MALLADSQQQGLGGNQTPSFFQPIMSWAREDWRWSGGGLGFQALGETRKRVAEQGLWAACRQGGFKLP